MWSEISNSPLFRECRPNQRNTFITVTVLFCILLAFFFSYAAFGNVETSLHRTLRSVHILFRHGNRTPTYFYPNDPHINRSWPGEEGSLTNEGKKELYRLGKFFRTFYKGFLPELYSSKELYIKSSSVPRCQMSAGTFLAGLYPPVGDQIWNNDLLWQPIPVNPIPRDRDNLIVARANCPAYTKEKNKSDEKLLNDLPKNQKYVFAYASEHTGQTITDLNAAEQLHGTLQIEEENGLELPDWTKNIYPEPLRTMAALNIASITRTHLLKRLKSGPLLSEWLSNLENYEKNESPLLFLYSGHDITIINIMRSLELMTDSSWWFPDYGASLVLEFHEKLTLDDSTVYVKFLYLNTTNSKKLNELKLPDCDVECPLAQFKTILKPLIPKDWHQECNEVLEDYFDYP